MIYAQCYKCNFFIFSDDIKWCKYNLNLNCNSVFVDNIKSSVEELMLIKHCKHNIIANSTFSWWGAWLNENKNKIIIAPKYWFKAKYSKHKSPALDDWIKI